MRGILLSAGRAPAAMFLIILAALYHKDKNEPEKEKIKPVK